VGTRLAGESVIENLEMGTGRHAERERERIGDGRPGSALFCGGHGPSSTKNTNKNFYT
jgi:hypothetical protein